MSFLPSLLKSSLDTRSPPACRDTPSTVLSGEPQSCAFTLVLKLSIAKAQHGAREGTTVLGEGMSSQEKMPQFPSELQNLQEIWEGEQLPLPAAPLTFLCPDHSVLGTGNSATVPCCAQALPEPGAL